AGIPGNLLADQLELELDRGRLFAGCVGQAHSLGQADKITELLGLGIRRNRIRVRPEKKHEPKRREQQGGSCKQIPHRRHHPVVAASFDTPVYLTQSLVVIYEVSHKPAWRDRQPRIKANDCSSGKTTAASHHTAWPVFPW